MTPQLKSARLAELHRQYRDGMITADELAKEFDKVAVRGGLGADGAYTGYDYDRQRWVELPAS